MDEQEQGHAPEQPAAEDAPEGPTAPAEPAEDADPADAAVDELHAAVRELREDADRVAGLAVDDEHVAAAEQLAEQAARLDESIASAARRLEGGA